MKKDIAGAAANRRWKGSGIAISVILGILGFVSIAFPVAAPLSGVLCLILSGVLPRFFQRQWETSEALKSSEAKHRTIFENIHDLYVESTLEGTIVTVSPSVKRILGYEVQELLGTNIMNLYDEPEQRKKAVEILLLQKELQNYQISVRGKGGRSHYLSIHVKYTEHGQGEKHIISICRDVTEYVEATRRQRESEDRYKLLFEKMLDGFSVSEPIYDEEHKLVDLRFTDANPAFERQTGLKAGEVIGKTWTQVWPNHKTNLDRLTHIMKTGQPLQFESFNTISSYYFLNSAFKIDDHHIGIAFQNITSYRKAVEQIQELNMDLERRVEERTSQLQNAVSELESFAHTVSHDLKSPLRAIDGYCSFILEDYGDQLEQEAREMTGNIRNICRDMIELINRLLTYAMTSQTPVNRESVDMQELVRESLQELRAGYPGRKMELAFEGLLPVVTADAVLLKQVVSNILSNALKFTGPMDMTCVEVGCTLTRKEYIFHVKDNGVGFDMEYAGKLFGIFQRLHHSREFEGSGIGLATIRKIIKKHGGRTWIEGKINKGAVVYFTLPALTE